MPQLPGDSANVSPVCLVRWGSPAATFAIAHPGDLSAHDGAQLPGLPFNLAADLIFFSFVGIIARSHLADRDRGCDGSFNVILFRVAGDGRGCSGIVTPAREALPGGQNVDMFQGPHQVTPGPLNLVHLHGQ